MKNHSSEADDLEIIDAHSHIGDCLYEGGGQTIDKKNLKARNRVLDAGWISAIQHGKLCEELEASSALFRAFIIYSDRKRNAGASLENMQAALGYSGVSRVCCLPIPPNVQFEDLEKARQKEARIIPFTGVDFDSMKGFEKKLQRDVARGAKGLKIHPILQKISPTDECMYQVIEEFGRYDLPILFHTGKTSYYFGKEKIRENPEYGRMESIEKLVAGTRDRANIILGHAGLSEFDYVAERMPRYPNVFVDTTFQNPERIQKLIKAFGSERVLFGSDWPFGDMKPAIEYVRQAVAQEPDPRVQTRIFRDNIRNLMHL